MNLNKTPDFGRVPRSAGQRHSPKKSRYAGFTLIELAIVSAIISMMVVAGLWAYSNQLESSKAEAQADQLIVLNNAVNKYQTNYYQKLVNNQSIPGYANAFAPTVAELVADKQLAGSFSPVNFYSGGYKVQLSLMPTGCSGATCDIQGLSYLDTPVRNSKNAVDSSLLGAAILKAGGDSGYSPISQGGTILGVSSGWSVANPLGNIPGILAMRNGYGTTGLAQFLRRDGSLPMTGDFDAGNNNVKNAKNGTFTGTVSSGTVSTGTMSANTANVSGGLTAGSANVSGNMTAGSANVNGNLVANTASVSNTLNVGGAATTGSLTTGNLQAWGTASVQGDANVQGTVNTNQLQVNGNSNVNGTSYTNGSTVWGNQQIGGSQGINGSQQVNGNQTTYGQMYVQGRITANEYLQLNGNANAGWGCSPYGLVARDYTGALLTCTNGVWTAPGKGDNANLSQNGWTTLPSGLIFQWGWTSNHGDYKQQCFNFTFPHAVFHVSVETTGRDYNGANGHDYIGSVNNSCFGYTSEVNASGTYWFAIGY